MLLSPVHFHFIFEISEMLLVQHPCGPLLDSLHVEMDCSELTGGAAWKPVSCLGPVFSPGLYTTGVFQAGIWRDQSRLFVRVVSWEKRKSMSHGHYNPCCPWPAHLLSLVSEYKVQHRISHWHHQRTPGISQDCLSPADSGWDFQPFLMFYLFICGCSSFVWFLWLFYVIQLLNLVLKSHTGDSCVQKKAERGFTQMKHVTHQTCWVWFPPLFSRLNVK